MYKKKYLKYKFKYLNLKKKQRGGEDDNEIKKSSMDIDRLNSELKKQNNKLMIICHAPWCSYCKQFMIEPNCIYKQLIINPEINLYNIDFTIDEE